jgi:hypothetical protein
MPRCANGGKPVAVRGKSGISHQRLSARAVFIFCRRHVWGVFMPTLRILICIASLAVLAACAGSNAGAKPDAGTTRVSSGNPACLKDTGSRIPSDGADCGAFGRSYSSDDIYGTGSTTASGALRILDPSITAR